MAKLADALASGASRGNPVQVQVLLSALFFYRLQTERTAKAVLSVILTLFQFCIYVFWFFHRN